MPSKTKSNTESAEDAQRITKSTAKVDYKLTRASVLAKISFIEKRNPHSRHAAPMCLYLEAAVESLAFEVHGGAFGHEAYLKKLAATAAKAADTRRKRKLGLLDSDSDKEDNKPSTPSTPSKPSKKKQRTALHGVKIFSDDEDDEEDADYEYKREESPTPIAGPSGSRY
ncbi:hypothetical protein JCM8547_008775 [Rhodosporidiobolus lusitaniae]